MKSVLEVLEATAAYFGRHGVENPRLNADLLLADALGMRRLDLYMNYDRPLSEQELEPLRDKVRRRAAGVPLQHLMGTVEFHGRVFASDTRALIPRPETEYLVELILKEPLPEAPALLDVGTGSGVIALTLAAERPSAQVTAVDLSEEALSLARENAARLGLAERVTFRQGDLLEGVTEPFHAIVANLPYVSQQEMEEVSREVRHDPVLALVGGESGMEIIVRLIAQARERLHPGGLLALEIGHRQAEALSEELARQNYRDIRAIPDYQGALRFLFATYG